MYDRFARTCSPENDVCRMSSLLSRLRLQVAVTNAAYVGIQPGEYSRVSALKLRLDSLGGFLGRFATCNYGFSGKAPGSLVIEPFCKKIMS